MIREDGWRCRLIGALRLLRLELRADDDMVDRSVAISGSPKTDGTCEASLDRPIDTAELLPEQEKSAHREHPMSKYTNGWPARPLRDISQKGRQRFHWTQGEGSKRAKAAARRRSSNGYRVRLLEPRPARFCSMYFLLSNFFPVLALDM